MTFPLPPTTFNEECILQQELDDYDELVKAVGLLQVIDRESGQLMYDLDDNPWFLIEHVTSTKLFLDNENNYFLRDDDSYNYQWLAFRVT